MEGKTKTIDGKQLILGYCQFQEATELIRAIAGAIRENKIGVDIDLSKIDSILEMEIPSETIGDIINTVLSVATSRELEKRLITCARHSIFDDTPINSETFASPENWKYYYPVMAEVAIHNASPFFENLLSGFGDIGKKIADILKSKLMQDTKSQSPSD